MPVQIIYRLFVSLALFVLSGCAGPIPKRFMEEVSPNTDFERVIRNPSSAVRKKVLWGGEIFKTETHEDYTLIEVIQKSLGFKERPFSTDESGGRFLVEFRGQFLDPAIYKAGREVTITGKVIRVEKKKLGQMNYRYPYVLASYVHLWPEQPKRVSARYPQYSYCGLYCRYPFDPYYPSPYYSNPYYYSDPFLRRPFGFFQGRSPYFFLKHRFPERKKDAK